MAYIVWNVEKTQTGSVSSQMNKRLKVSSKIYWWDEIHKQLACLIVSVELNIMTVYVSKLEIISKCCFLHDIYEWEENTWIKHHDGFHQQHTMVVQLQ